MRFTADDIAQRTGGEVIGDPSVEVVGATQDSRTVAPGQLFVPLVAGRDGHEFIPVAVERGATAYLASDRARVVDGATAIAVEDTQVALVDLGRAARHRLDGAVVGITGSVGKTTVKDLARGVLGAAAPTHASAASFNNEIGVPLTLLGTPDGTRHVVVEMGARGIGHIAELCAIAHPTVGVVTRVAMAHSELFGTIEDIARGKGEMVEQLPADGTAVLNAGDQRVAAMADRTSARVLTFGLGVGDVRATTMDVAADLRLRVLLETPWGAIEVEPAARGPHNAENAAAAAAIGLGVGMDLADVATGLAAAEMSPLRMAITTSRSGVTILDDSYNANPTSMRAALDALAHLPAERRVAVVGLMAELGPESDAEHEAVAALAEELGVELIAVDCPEYRADAHGGRAVHDIDGALDLLDGAGTGTAVLAKGSRVAGLDRLVAALADR
ncbi:UDP-N-acetylmuramoyl-tripeptide--D-alanyl-D-alanine ligase [Actinomarinicola tropica]|uniref:UDP-N-acetylmuramoyl-tripeptide--D-alanyl-D- alanine ligase n=1 Tax=Actinomarinicola tropica TaxID=2789776 RepID=UPI00189A215A|nr:UDP-N-acetylmuramoyl-tripeptide--D-alanyl-D-alanine ligase [Actinomarinicola tropica]